MLDQEDEGTRIGVWVALGVVFFVLVGVIGGLVMRQVKANKAPAPAAVSVAAVAEAAASAVAEGSPAAAATAAAIAAATSAADQLVDAPLAGDLRGTAFFAVGSADLDATAKDVVTYAAKEATNDAGTLLVSGFHDASGDPAKNAELAKQRAIHVAAALIDAGIPAERVKLRKPESTTGDGSDDQARRVEIRLVP